MGGNSGDVEGVENFGWVIWNFFRVVRVDGIDASVLMKRTGHVFDDLIVDS
jgi:hypothetical protein